MPQKCADRYQYRIAIPTRLLDISPNSVVMREEAVSRGLPRHVQSDCESRWQGFGNEQYQQKRIAVHRRGWARLPFIGIV